MNEMCSNLTGNLLVKCQVEENAFSGAGRSNAVQSVERHIHTVKQLTALSHIKTICKLMQH